MAARRIGRRGILKAAAIGIPALALGGGGVGGWMFAAARTDTVGAIEFTNRLAVPPLALSHLDGRGRRVFDLRAGVVGHAFLAGAPTEAWGYNGSYLGPTLRASRGETVLVRVRNDLDEPTSLHWHGMHLPAAMDGGPHQMIEPGRDWHSTWTVNQPAATLWYHPHPHEQTARHVYRGLAGLFIVDDAAGHPHGLPSRYGVDDFPLIVQDKRFGDGNELDGEPPVTSSVGILGDTVCVNGTVAPYLDVTTERVRLRLLNASNARVYAFGFADGRRFSMVATDGGLLPAPYETDRIQLSPGERAEIVVAMSRGERVVLRSFPPDLGVNFWDERFSGGDDTLDILELRAAPELAPSPPLPRELAAAPAVDTSSVAAVREFRLSGHEINGKPMDMARIDFAAVKDSTEIWEVVAVDDQPHNFHVHDVQFQVLSVGGAEPPPHLRGWKDTVYTPANTPIRVALRFADHADPNTPYMFHCHLLYHEDQGLMGQFVVTEPGQRPGTPPVVHHG